MAVAEKIRAFEERQQKKDRDLYDMYRAKRAVVKRAVNVAKRMADWLWGGAIGD